MYASEEFEPVGEVLGGHEERRPMALLLLQPGAALRLPFLMPKLPSFDAILAADNDQAADDRRDPGNDHLQKAIRISHGQLPTADLRSKQVDFYNRNLAGTI